METAPHEPPGPRYTVNIEGENHDWNEPTITTEQIAQLGGFDPAQGVILIDKDNNERTLAPGEVVELKPGMGFAKKVRFKRGRDRIAAELDLLRALYPDMEARPDGWVRLPRYALMEGWSPDIIDVAFQIQPAYPGAPPYGIYVQPPNLTFNGRPPTNYKASANCPFPGAWGVFSWQPETWKPGATPTSGTNLVNWVHGFRVRFAEGA